MYTANKKSKLLQTALLGLGLSLASSAYSASALQQVTAKATSSYAKTQYPIVFVHGFSGFSRVGTDQLGVDYWYQILPDLARNGATTFAASVSPFNSTEIRGEQLLSQVEEVLAITGKDKVNLIGHSHGGPTIRYVAGVQPTKVASLSSVSGSHKGTALFDLILKTEGTPFYNMFGAIGNFFGQAISFAQGLDPNASPMDMNASGHSVSTAGSLAFNQKFPMGVPTTACGEGAYKEQNIYMYSFSGTKPLTNIFDPLEGLFVAGDLILQGANDGIITRCSAKFGRSINDSLPWNHGDEINQVMGLRGLFTPNPVDVYRQHANRLKLQGL